MDTSFALESATREVFGNVAPWMRVVFYVIMTASLAVPCIRIYQRVHLWQQGRAGGFRVEVALGLRRLAVYALAQKRVHRKSLGGLLHLLLFSGFVVLTMGTTLLAIADQGPINFHQGHYFLWYELTLDIFGLIFCAGCAIALIRRSVARPKSLGHQGRDWILLGILLALGITGFLVEALRLCYSDVPVEVARWSVVGHAIHHIVLGDLGDDSAARWHLVLWWIHAFLVAGLFAFAPVTRFLHIFTAPLNLATRPENHPGRLSLVSPQVFEQTGQIGVSRIGDFSNQTLASLDACMECGRCEDSCPASQAGKPLSPKALIVDLRRAMEAKSPTAPLHETCISSETLWSCTTCQACVSECPTLIGHVDMIVDLRRHLVAEGRLSGTPARTLGALGRSYNPFARPSSERLAWAKGLSVPTVGENPSFDYLLWVGCAGAYDPRAQKATQALARLLTLGKVNFAVLGSEERCTGDAARRMGDEFLFQELATSNVGTLKRYNVQRIVTPCPHCFNTIRNEYPQLGGQFEVYHHSQLLADLVQQGRLSRVSPDLGSVTLHDPCYLARANGETEAPREVLSSDRHRSLVELPRHGTKTHCCGAGGGRMWFDEAPGQRVSRTRALEIEKTGAGTVATACPFCANMLADGVAGAQRHIRTVDIAELLVESQDPK